MSANAAIPYFKPGTDVTVHATEALTGKTFVRVVSTGRGTLPDATPATAGGRALGVVGHDIAADGHVHVNVGGIIPVTAGADITANDPIAVGEGGTAVPAEAEALVVGYAVASAATGADAAVLLK